MVERGRYRGEVLMLVASVVDRRVEAPSYKVPWTSRKQLDPGLTLYHLAEQYSTESKELFESKSVRYQIMERAAGRRIFWWHIQSLDDNSGE